ncbi:MAG: type II toxin-antitoxin system HicB family antitoxin [Anaerostipes sp.]|jgi:hypothetical protein|nr:type II toxin-antitoxin system HicB family antitoxin [Anaerostipes sp.]
MKGVYPVIFTQLHDEKDTVLIEVPDLKILTEGFGMADAIDMARDAIGLKGICYEDDGKELSKASTIEEINVSNSTFAEEGKGNVSLVDVDFVEYRRRNDTKMVRRNVTLPNWLNVAAEKEHLNVSRVLQEALMTRVGMQK